jgi:hypothetical protein
VARSSFKDPRGRHVRVYVDLLNSPAWRALSWSARSLFIDLRAALGKVNNGDLSATLSDLKHRGWTSSTTLAGALYELLALGFITRTRAGGVESGSKTCSLYAFTDEAILAMPGKGIEARPATHGYRRFETLSEAEQALTDGVRRLREEAIARKLKAVDRKKSTLQILERHAAVSGAVKASSAADSGAVASLSLQILEQTRHH